LRKALVSIKNISKEDIIFIKKLLDNSPDYLYKISIEDLFKNIDDIFFEN
jgi:hypothetical protein